MKQRLFLILSGLSLLLAIAAGGMWVRSYWRTDYIPGWTDNQYVSNGVVAVLESDRGRIFVCWPDDDELKSPFVHPYGRLEVMHLVPRDNSYPDDSLWAYLGVHYHGYMGNRGGFNLFIAYRVICLPALILPLLYWRQRRRRLAFERIGRCRSCGYDLRASPDRCPECGTLVGGLN